MLLLKLAGWKFHNDPQNSIVVFKWYYYCSFSSQFSKSLLLQFCLFFFCWYWKKHAHLFLCLTTAILRFMWNWLIFYTELKALTILKDINTCCYTALRKEALSETNIYNSEHLSWLLWLEYYLANMICFIKIWSPNMCYLLSGMSVM